MTALPEGRPVPHASFLTRARERVLATPAEWRAHCPSYEEVETRLEELCVAIEGLDMLLSPGATASERVLQQRLLDLLRWQLITDPDTQCEDGQLLGVIRRIEVLRRSLQPPGDDVLPAHTGNAESLDLVIEVAHDLRSPLTSILFLAETMRKGQTGPINEIQKKQLGIIYSAGFGLLSVASDMIEMARGESLRETDSAAFSIADLFEQVRAMVSPLSEEKNLTLEFFGPEHDVRLGHIVPLSRVLLNLVTNAIKFTEEGFIQVAATPRGRTRLLFTVRDTGPGIEGTRRQRLYQPFRRRQQGNGFRLSGTGLGLSICRRLVEAMGGELHVHSEPDWGTEFSFELHLPPAPLTTVL